MLTRIWPAKFLATSRRSGARAGADGLGLSQTCWRIAPSRPGESNPEPAAYIASATTTHDYAPVELLASAGAFVISLGICSVPTAGLEPATHGSSDHCSSPPDRPGRASPYPYWAQVCWTEVRRARAVPTPRVRLLRQGIDQLELPFS